MFTPRIRPRRAQGQPASTSTLVLLLLPALVLLGCAGAPTLRPGDRVDGNDAEAYYQRGDFDRAERAFARLAESDPARQDSWTLRAADAAWLAGRTGRSMDRLDAVARNRLTPDQQRLADLLSVLTGLLQPRSPRLALEILRPPAGGWPELYQPDVLRLRARAYADAGDPYQSARQLVALAPWMMDRQGAVSNRQAILETLSALSSDQALAYLDRHYPADEMYGWLALVADVKSTLVANGSVAEAVAGWRLRFPYHPAARDPFDSLLKPSGIDIGQPDQIAVLLPFSGRFPRSARAVRDGITSAYLTDPDRRAELRFYDSGDSPEQALAMYRRAVANGAELVIGPLQRDAVTALMLQADGSVPILALNYQEGDAPTAPGNLQFGLLPEQEAEAVADRMLRDGILRAAVLAPIDPWGARLTDAFIERYTDLGGAVLDIQRYAPRQQDHSLIVKQMVGVTDSEVRRRRLSGLLGEQLSFEAQPRHDLDGVFLAARPQDARLIKPQMAFYNASAIPVYATSHAYDGRSDPSVNRDLNGVIFCDAPYLLRSREVQPDMTAAAESFESVDGPMARLFAVGMDAYRILPYLNWLGSLGADYFPGATGNLSLDYGGRIRRDLHCAQFQRGRAVYLPPAELDLAER
ncbi:MAG: penicillin-binding protein activator [Xanthomonadales bacterium]|nr:penicillin-binding protein activator [Xanthomonadales bacterium]